uniref:Uncharacterized protein n=1 Tax=Siphoviridae sp. ctiOl67 TaxID=2825622 RepID=A0A8S5QIY7_9CAUD|nr:MAG TPA: hypothetical protein [Siphoviridae sp. ctiOl67]
MVHLITELIMLGQLLLTQRRGQLLLNTSVL